MPVLVEPIPARLVIGHDHRQRVPIGGGVVPDPGVHQLVDHNVVNHLQRRHDQPPGKAQRTRAAARTPAGARPTDADLLVLEAVLLGIPGHTLSDQLAGLPPVPGFEDGVGARLISLSQVEASVVGQGFGLVVDYLERIGLPEVQEGFSFDELARPITLCHLPGEGLFLQDPGLLLMDKSVYQDAGSAQRSTHDQAPIAADVQADGLALAADELVNFHRENLISKKALQLEMITEVNNYHS